MSVGQLPKFEKLGETHSATSLKVKSRNSVYQKRSFLDMKKGFKIERLMDRSNQRKHKLTKMRDSSPSIFGKSYVTYAFNPVSSLLHALILSLCRLSITYNIDHKNRSCIETTPQINIGCGKHTCNHFTFVSFKN